MPKKSSTPTTTTDTTTQAPETPIIVPNTKLTITIPWEKAEPAYKKARNRVAQTVKISGFRKGKVPADVAEKMLGSEQIIEKALEEILPEAYISAVKAAEKKPLTQPSFQAVAVNVGEEWVIEAQIAERPEIKLGEYSKTVKAARTTAEKEIAEQAAAVKKQADEAEKHTGKDEKASEAHQHDHAGHDHTHAPQPLTDAQKKELTLQHIYQALVETVKPQIPELLVQHEVEYDLEQLGRQLQAIQMTFAQYLERRGISQEQLTQQMAMGAVGRIQLVFIIDQIATDKKLEVSEAEVQKYLEEKVDPQVRAQYAGSPEYQNLIRQTILRQKVADSLLAI